MLQVEMAPTTTTTMVRVPLHVHSALVVICTLNREFGAKS